MLPHDIIVLEVETFSPGQMQRIADYFTSLTTGDPKGARNKRSSVRLSFEKAGCRRAQDDLRSRAFMVELRAAFPGFGYFVSADPPIYHLRGLSCALAIADGEVQHKDAFEIFGEVHHRNYLAAAALAHDLRDGDADALELAFVTNLLHGYMTEDIARRAMRVLLPVLLAVFPTPTSRLAKLAFAEAGALTGRTVDEFATPVDYVREMQRLAG